MTHKVDKKPTPKRFFKKRYLLLVFVILFGLLLWKKMQPPAWWQFSLGEQITQQPVLYKGSVILATNHGTLLSLNQRSGKIEWQHNHEKDISSQPFIKNNLLYTAYIDGTVVAVNPTNGELKWVYRIPNSKVIYTGLLNSETKLIFGDSGGVLHGLSLKDGSESWTVNTPNPDTVDELLTPNGLSWFGSILLDRGKLYVIRTQGYVAELNPDNGKVDWEQQLPATVISEPVLTRTSLLLSTTQDALVSFSRQNGKMKVAPTPQNKEQVFCQAGYSQDGFLSDLLEKTSQEIPRSLMTYEREWSEQSVQVDKAGSVVSYDRNTLEPKWQLELGYQPKRCFYDQESGLYVASDDGQLSKIDLKKRAITWQKKLANRILTINSIQKSQYLNQEKTKRFYTDLLFISDDQEKLTRINPQNGEVKWTFKADGTLYVPPALHVNQLFIVNTNGGLSRLNVTTGEPDQSRFSPRILARPISETVGEGEVFELRLQTPSGRYNNPYTAVELAAEFTNEEGKTVPIQGFFYNTNEWRVRFNPPTAGVWTWKVHWKDAFQSKDFSGKLTSKRAFTPLHALPESRWLTKDGKTIQPVVGLNECIMDSNRDGSPLNDFFLRDGSRKVSTISGDIPDTITFNTHFTSLELYLDTYRPGFNLFRQSVSNCSPPLYYAENFLYSRYLAHEGSYFDQISQQLYKRGFNVWFTMFGFSLPFDGEVNYPDERTAIENYVRYVVARYGAYVDIWEISNEAVAGEEYVKRFADLIKANDPYNRLITVSWDKPKMNEITLIAPHWYQTEPDGQSDLATIAQLNPYKEFKKPVVFGEQGNKDQNWDETSAQRMRVRIWTAFFHQAGLIFWNQSSSKNHYNATFGNSNIYLGDEERQYTEVFMKLTQNLPLDLLPQPDPPPGGIRIYTLKNDSLLLQYIFNAEVNQFETTTTVNTLSQKAKAEWFDTRTGEIIRTEEVNAGATFVSPQFTRDVLLKLTAL